MISINDSDASDILSQIVDTIVETKGSKRAFDQILSLLSTFADAIFQKFTLALSLNKLCHVIYQWKAYKT